MMVEYIYISTRFEAILLRLPRLLRPQRSLSPLRPRFYWISRPKFYITFYAFSRSKNTLWKRLFLRPFILNVAFWGQAGGLSQSKRRSDPGFLIDVAIFQINLLFSERSSFVLGYSRTRATCQKWKALDMTECRLVSSLLLLTSLLWNKNNCTLCCFSEFVCFS